MNKTVQILALLIIVAIFFFGVIGLFFPNIYADFYIYQLINLHWLDYYNENREIGTLIKVIFQANGLSMVMSSILAFSILVYSAKKGQKWGIISLIIVGLIGGAGEIFLEIVILNLL